MLKYLMPVLTLSLLGPFAAALDKKPLYKFRTNKVQALLIYLAVESGQVHRRESLVTLLWPGLTQTSAQVNLRQTIYRLCQAIPKVSARDSDGLVPLISSSRQTVQINPDASVRLDVESFRQLIDDDSAQAAALYRGDFLADFSLYDSNLFEEWAETTREGLRRQALNALDKLTTTHIEQGAYDVAQTYAWRQLEIDDLRERAVRQLMITLDRAGRWNAALAQHQLYQQRLAQELGVEPSAETTMLYKQIQADALRETLKRRTLRKPDVAGNMPVFLLTDIEGSTRLWDTYRQSMLSALLRHNAILEEQITRHGGRILELRGDGVKAVFEGVNPLPCVLAIQREFDRADWGEIGEVRIRIGLHGVPTIRKGYDYFEEDHKYYGPVLNHTARIMDAGWGGQILVSEQVRNTFSLPPGASWQDFGLHTLKSLDEPHRIYGLLHPDLPYLSFPPLRTLTTRAEPEPEARLQPVHNLELQPTPFIGRETELAKLDVLIDDPDVRLVTIVGPGGMGKTRIALATAERQILRPSANGRPSTGDAGYLFPDGIYFVSLAPLVSSDYIIPTVARVLNAPLETGQNMDMLEWTEEAARTPQEQLFEYLHPKKMLIVMDNFEHLLDGAGIITDILRAAPAVRVLVTSRERLRVREEQVFPIQGHTTVPAKCPPGTTRLRARAWRHDLPDPHLPSGGRHAPGPGVGCFLGGYAFARGYRERDTAESGFFGDGCAERTGAASQHPGCL
ncbi:MAG: BTAD domain-containing putative transcriptional regulator [Anaerolineales bacterium]